MSSNTSQQTIKLAPVPKPGASRTVRIALAILFPCAAWLMGCGESSAPKDTALSAQAPAPAEGADPMAVAAPAIPLKDGKPDPERPIPLRYRIDAPVSYMSKATSRLGVAERTDMKQVFNSAARVRYEMVDSVSIPRRVMSRPFRDNPDVPDEVKAGRRVLVTVEAAAGEFDEPKPLMRVERSHQMMRSAAFSYVLHPNGRVEDVQVHEPLNPLARGSMARIVRLAESVQAVFPDYAVKPGDTWKQEILYRDRGAQALGESDITNVYTFDEWRPCRDSTCVFISIKQTQTSRGSIDANPAQARAQSTGEGEGWLMFDPVKGQLIKSYWRLRGEGDVEASQKATGEGQKDASARSRMRVEVEATFERIDDQVLPTVAPNQIVANNPFAAPAPNADGSPGVVPQPAYDPQTMLPKGMAPIVAPPIPDPPQPAAPAIPSAPGIDPPPIDMQLRPQPPVPADPKSPAKP